MAGRVFTKRTRAQQRQYEEELDAFEYKPMRGPQEKRRRTDRPVVVIIDENGEREETAAPIVAADPRVQRPPAVEEEEEGANADEQPEVSVGIKEEPRVKQELADDFRRKKRKKKRKKAVEHAASDVPATDETIQEAKVESGKLEQVGQQAKVQSEDLKSAALDDNRSPPEHPADAQADDPTDDEEEDRLETVSETSADWTDLEDKIARFNCSTCGFKTNNRAYYRGHLNGHSRTSGFSCSFCGIFFKFSGKRNHHEQTQHRYQRRVADETYNGAIKIKKNDLKKYTQVGTNFAEVQMGAKQAGEIDAELMCTRCGYVTNNPQFFRGHLSGHSKTTGFSCSFCGVFYQTNNHRNIHEQNVHGFEREEADKTYNGGIIIPPNDLKNYTQVGTNFAEIQAEAKAAGGSVQKPRFICSACGYGTSHQGHFHKHSKKHSNTNGFCCSLCGIFYEASRLRNIHEETLHDFERQGEDKMCKGAVRIASVELEKYKHVGTNFAEVQVGAKIAGETAEPWFTCATCGFETNHALPFRDHVKAHSKTDGYRCSLCGVFCAESSYRNRHELAQHGFKRQGVDRGFRGAIRIPARALEKYERVGTNFVEIQLEAKKAGEHFVKRSKRGKGNCKKCGLLLALVGTNHPAAHAGVRGKFRCSVCGTSFDRSRILHHEINVHNFVRDMADKRTTKAIRIPSEQYAQLRNLTTNFAAVQSRAVSSRRIDSSEEEAEDEEEVPTFSESEDEELESEDDDGLAEVE